MSKIFEALRSAEATRKSDVQVAEPKEKSKKEHNRRRSKRLDFDSVIRVYGHTENGITFYEEALTVNVSTHGALLELKVAVAVGQKLLLINEETKRQQICQIVNSRTQETGALQVAVEFPVPHAEFWQIFAKRHKSRSSQDRRQPASGVEAEDLVTQPS
jgi:hypothetical protein